MYNVVPFRLNAQLRRSVKRGVSEPFRSIAHVFLMRVNIKLDDTDALFTRLAWSSIAVSKSKAIEYITIVFGYNAVVRLEELSQLKVLLI